MKKLSNVMSHAAAVFLMAAAFACAMGAEGKRAVTLPDSILATLGPSIEIYSARVDVALPSGARSLFFVDNEAAQVAVQQIRAANESDVTVSVVDVDKFLAFRDGQGNITKSIPLEGWEIDEKAVYIEVVQVEALVSADKKKVLIITTDGDRSSIDSRNTSRVHIYNAQGDIEWEYRLIESFYVADYLFSATGDYVTLVEKRSLSSDFEEYRGRFVSFHQGKIIFDIKKGIGFRDKLVSSPSGEFVASSVDVESGDAVAFFDLKKRKTCIFPGNWSPYFIDGADAGISTLVNRSPQRTIIKVDIQSCSEL